MRSGGPPKEVDVMSTFEEMGVKDEIGNNTTRDFDSSGMHSDLSLSSTLAFTTNAEGGKSVAHNTYLASPPKSTGVVWILDCISQGKLINETTKIPSDNSHNI